MASNPKTIIPVPAGLANLRAATDPVYDQDGRQIAVTEAVNVDLTPSGQPRRRRGQVTRIDGQAHSLFAARSHLLAIVDGALNAYTAGPDGALTLAAQLRSGLGDRYTTYATNDSDVWWSNGADSGRIADDLSVHPFWIATPDPVSLAAAAAGGLARGAYEVSVTAIDADGRESGASNPVAITIASGQGIQVALPAAPSDAVSWCIYVSPPNGDVLYQCASLAAAATSYTIGVHRPSRVLETAWMTPIPACDVLRYGHGRLVAVSRNVLMWSEPYRLGLMADQNYLTLGNACTLLEPVGDGDSGGWWVADHKRTYWMAGSNPEAWTQIARYPHAAVPGTSLVVPGSIFGLDSADPVAFWLAANGTFCLGLPGGVLMPIRESQVAASADAERGASTLMLFDGLKQVLTTVVGGTPSQGVASDAAEVTVIRRHLSA